MADTRHIHLVGSMNLPDAEGAMTTAASLMGEGLLRLPDGEPGPRRGWIYYQRPMFTHNRYLGASPDALRNGIADVNAKRVLRDGVRPDDLEFPELGYAREAQTSYAWFKKAKADGRIPKHLRFQVSLPTPFACLVSALEADAVADVEPAYEAAMLGEVEKICLAIPREELAIQWDICVETLLFDGRSSLPWGFDETAHRARFRRLTSAVPEQVHHGVHLCYGDFDGKHVVEPLDAAKLVGLANLISEEAGRPLQWIHIPVPIDRHDDAYFAPLADLKLNAATELFLGLVHHADGVKGTTARINAAEKFVSQFGIGTECGIGRMHSTAEIHELFKIHAEAAVEGRADVDLQL